MAKFDVKVSGLNQAAESEKALEKELQGIASDIESIISNTYLNSKATNQIKRKLRDSMNAVSTAEQKLRVLSQTLVQVAKLYQDTESRIMNQTGKARDDNRIGVEAAGIAGGIAGDIQQIHKRIQTASDAARKSGLITGVDNSSMFSADPVNLSNGNYVYEKSFLKFDTVIPMEFRIFYNIQSEEAGVLGRGWIHSYEVHLIHDGEKISMVRDDSSLLSFFKDEEGAYYPLFGTFGSLRRTEEGYEVTDRDKFIYCFDENGRWTNRKNPFGNTLTLSYGEDSKLSAVRDEHGNSYQFCYDAGGKLKNVSDQTGRLLRFRYEEDKIVEIMDPEGWSFRYLYDQNGLLTGLKDGRDIVCLRNTFDSAKRTVRQEFPDGGVVSYEYLDDAGQVRMTEQNGNVIVYERDELYRTVKNIYENGEEKFTFNENHQRTSFTDRNGNTSYYDYDENGNPTSFKNALGDELQYTYTQLNQIQSVAMNGTVLYHSVYNDRNLQESVEDALGGKSSYEYDEAGQLVAWIMADGCRIEITYDETGNMTSITNTMGGRTSYTYDEMHRVIKITNPMGEVTEFAYNDVDEIIWAKNANGKTQTYEYDACGNLTKAVDLAGGVTIFVYNAMNQPVKITNPENQSIFVEYDKMWNPVKQIAKDGGITSYEYDRLHRLVKVTDPVGAVNCFSYDACGNMTERIAPDGGVYKLAYDALNRPNQVIDPCGHVVKAEYDSMGNVTKVLFEDGAYEEYKYNINGNVVYSRDRSGYEKTYTYDKLGNLLRVEDDETWLEEYAYYPGGLRKSEKYIDGSGRSFTYDVNENLIEITNQDGCSWHFSYDNLERIVKCSQDGGISESYEYDALDHITAVTDGEGNRTVYAYSPCGDIVSVTDALGNETYFQYDACNRVVGIVQSEDGKPDIAQMNQFNRQQKNLRITSYERDLAGNVVKTVNPNGIETCYTYDGCGRILSQKDGDGNLTTCAYNPDGTEKGYTFADGRFVKYRYNAMKQLIQMEDWLGRTIVENDVMGRVEKVTYPDGEAVAYEWGKKGELKNILYPNRGRAEYCYDKAQRLISFRSGEEKVDYTYFENGFLKKKDYNDGFCTAYQFDASGKIREICHRQGETVLDKFSYQYDKNDRKSRIIRERNGADGSGIYDYHYTALGYLALVTRDGTEEERYEYDIFGNRIFSNVRGKETAYAYNRLNQLIHCADMDGEHNYTYDGRGNLTGEDLNGKPVKRLEFDALNLLSKVEMENRCTEYICNGFTQRVGKNVFQQGQRTNAASFLYDIANDNNQPLRYCMKEMGQNGTAEIKAANVMWDGGLLGLQSDRGNVFCLNDEMMTPQWVVGKESVLSHMQYDSFGNMTDGLHTEGLLFGYTGFQIDKTEEFYYANHRQYSPVTGRFISPDPFPGFMMLTTTLNAYTYCAGDPMNYIDPTGMIFAWLAGGIVGAVTNVVTKVAGDVVNSVKSVAEGKGLQFSSWQSYVGAATGGFVSGSVFVASGGNGAVASAAGGAAETLVTGGLSMLTGAKGYRKEDGYSFGRLIGETAFSAATGFSTGWAFGKATKYIKIPGITKGRGSCESVWKQVMTKASKGQIANVTLKTLGKGILAYGPVKMVDQILVNGMDKIKDMMQGKLTDFAKDTIGRMKDKIFPQRHENVAKSIQYMSCNRGLAVCPAAGL